MSILKITREAIKNKQANAIIAEIKMRKWKKFLQNVEQKIKWWKLWKKEKDIGVLGDENEARWGESLTKETEEKIHCAEKLWIFNNKSAHQMLWRDWNGSILKVILVNL